jgi:hypothetical protein
MRPRIPLHCRGAPELRFSSRNNHCRRYVGVAAFRGTPGPAIASATACPAVAQAPLRKSTVEGGPNLKAGLSPRSWRHGRIVLVVRWGGRAVDCTRFVIARRKSTEVQILSPAFLTNNPAKPKPAKLSVLSGALWSVLESSDVGKELLHSSR